MATTLSDYVMRKSYSLPVEPLVSEIALGDLPIIKSGVEFRTKTSKYAVVIPIWNQGETIGPQLRRMSQAGCTLDIILADGDSNDGSTELEFLKSTGVRTLLVTPEKGLGRALQMGIYYAMVQGYDGVITLDGNGKDGIEAIDHFARALEDGYDLVQGSRFAKNGRAVHTPWDRYLGIRLLINPLISLASGFPYTDATNGFKAMSRRLILDNQMALFRRQLAGFSFQFYLNYRSGKLGFQVCELPVIRVYPKRGKTPTKISGLNGRAKLLFEFFQTIFGRFNT